MPENQHSGSAAILAARNHPGPVGNDSLLSAVEAGLEPFVLVFVLWSIAFYFEGTLSGAYLILSVIVFSISFPGTHA